MATCRYENPSFVEYAFRLPHGLRPIIDMGILPALLTFRHIAFGALLLFLIRCAAIRNLVLEFVDDCARDEVVGMIGADISSPGSGATLE